MPTWIMAEIVVATLLIASSNASRLFEAVDQPLDFVAQPIGGRSKLRWRGWSFLVLTRISHTHYDGCIIASASIA